jgi:serine/threonine protein kinase
VCVKFGRFVSGCVSSSSTPVRRRSNRIKTLQTTCIHKNVGHFRDKAKALENLQRESSIIVKLKHPHIVKIHEYIDSEVVEESCTTACTACIDFFLVYCVDDGVFRDGISRRR